MGGLSLVSLIGKRRAVIESSSDEESPPAKEKTVSPHPDKEKTVSPHPDKETREEKVVITMFV